MDSPFPALSNLFRRLAPSTNGHGNGVPISRFRKYGLKETRRSEEKLKSRYAFGGKEIAGQFWFLPYTDTWHNETETMRAAYRGMLRSPYIKSPLMMKCYSIASLDWEIIAERSDSPRDIECAAFLRHCIERLPGGLPELAVTLTLPRLLDGYAIAEKVLEIERTEAKWHGKAVPKMVKSKNTDLYDLQVDEFNNVVGVKGKGANNSEDYYRINEFIYSRHMPVYDEPKGMSDLRAAYSSYWMLDTVTKLRAIHAEKYTTPALMGRYAVDEQKSSLEAAMAAFKANTWLAIPADTQLEALSLAAQGESDYKSFCDDSKRDMLIAIIGAYLQILEGQVSDGRGNADVSSKDVTSLFLWMLASQFQEIINKQFFPELVALNYAGVGKFTLKLGAVSEQELASIVANAQALQGMGYPISKSDLARRTSWGQAKTDDDKLMPPQQPQQPSPFGGALPFSEAKPKEPEPRPLVVVPSQPKPVESFAEETPRSAVARRAKQRAHGRFIPFADRSASEVQRLLETVKAKLDAPDPRIDKLSEQIAGLTVKHTKTVDTKLIRDADGRILGKSETETIE